MWFATWLALTLVLAATQVQLVVVSYQQRGDDTAYDGNATVVLTGSLAGDLRASVDVTSESQLAAESVRVMLLVAYSTGAIAAWLTAAAYRSRKLFSPRLLQVLVAGYVALAFVGLIPTAPPSAGGLGPRRNYTPLLVWQLDAGIGQGLHIAAAVLFLFLPPLAALAWLRPQAASRFRSWALAAYGALLLLNVAFVGTQVASEWVTGTDQDEGWLWAEVVAFGGNWFVDSGLHLWLLFHPDRARYARVQT